MKRRLFRISLGFLALAVVAAVFVAVIVETGVAERWARTLIVRQIEKSTGARVELGAFHFHLRGLRADLSNLTLHGREAPGLPPLFHADAVHVSVRIISLFGREIALNNLEVDKPSVFIRKGLNGETNIPPRPANRSRRPWREQLFNLRIAHLRIVDGTLMFNDAQVPLNAEGNNFKFAMEFDASSPGHEVYRGEVDWNQMQFAARRFLPFASDVSARFTLSRDSFSLDDLQFKTGQTNVAAHGVVRNFQPLDADFHYRGTVSLPDFRRILRKPNIPDGSVAVTGNGTYAQNKLNIEGHYIGTGIFLDFPWFHDAGMESSGDMVITNDHLTVPDLEARAVGGVLHGRLDLDFHGLLFRVVSHMTGDSLADVFESTDNPSFPVHTLHWDGVVSVDSVCTWHGDFKHVRARGISIWSPPAQTPPGHFPVTAQIHFDYSMDLRSATLAPSTIATPTSQLAFSGTLGDKDSSLAVTLHANRVADYQDFISYLRGDNADTSTISGSAEWKGRVTGSLNGPTFAGTFRVREARYGQLYWDDISGQMSYSPDVFTLVHALAQRGHSQARLELSLGLDGQWDFAADSPWTLDAHLQNASSDDLQALFGTDYPASASVTADFQGGGTRAAPELNGNFQLQNGQAYGIQFHSATGRISLGHDSIRIYDAEVDRNPGRLTGELTYHPETRAVEFQLLGEAIPLDKFRFIQSKALPIAGLLNFQLNGSGPLLSPVAHGTLQLDNLQFGNEVLDSFAGRLDSDGKTALLDIQSTKTAGKLSGHLAMTLSGDYPLAGQFSVHQIDLDPFIVAGLHLKGLTGNSSIDGQINISGDARKPETLTMQANLSRLSFDYEFVKLQSVGPVRLSYRHSEVTVDQAALSGTDTNFQISGSAGFSGVRELNLRIAGDVNLRLAEGFLPGLDARGSAQVRGAVTGTFSNPQVTGQVKIIDASAHYGDFPAGLSSMNGTVVFDRSRMNFENMTAKAGGGDLTLSGSMDYGQTPLRYEIDAVARQVRIRYPEGLSWLLGGQVRFSGTTSGALLSGNVAVQRLIFNENADFASLIVASQTNLTGPATSSPYLRNLRFDIGADAAPGARIEWAGAHFTAEGSVHVRGTWEHPIVLGNIHLLAGDMSFRGNDYRLTRGDVNFSNPFRFDPVLNVEATAFINPYQITLDFNGPASRMQISYRSDPPLPASDIVALLALGNTGESNALMSSSSTQTQNFGATALLSEAISSQLGGPLQKLFGINQFRVEPFLASTGTQQSAAARVTIQKQVTRDLSVTYSTNANSNQQQVIEVDYAVRRNITIVALRDINGIFGISVKFTQHFK